MFTRFGTDWDADCDGFDGGTAPVAQQRTGMAVACCAR
jgi:hypothetical protein